MNNMENQAKKETGNFIPIIIIIGILLAGGVYAFFKVQEAAYPEPSNAKIIHRPKAADPVMSKPESKSDNPEDIEKDLDMTDLDTLEKDLEVLQDL